MARVNKTKIVISLIEKEIESAKKTMEINITNKNFGAACSQDGRIEGLQKALCIINACTGEGNQ